MGRGIGVTHWRDKVVLLQLLYYARTYFQKQEMERSIAFIKNFARDRGIDLGARA